jgi:hypothetical protein
LEFLTSSFSKASSEREFAALEMEDGEEGLGGQEEAGPHQPASYT